MIGLYRLWGIDRVEALIARRFEIDPEKDLEEIKRLDAERADLIRQKMPRYKEVTQAFRGQARPRPPRPPKARVQWRKPR